MRFSALFLIAAGLLFSTTTAPAAEPADGFKPLFDGKTLEGWVGDPELWSVQDGVIVGSSENKKLPRNSFLATKETYGDFVLRLKFKLRNHNSGVQIRSKLHDGYRVTGYQADIADNQFLGILYEEGGRGILARVNGDEVKKHVNEGDWNEYEITAQGNKITQKLNGFTTVEYTETNADIPTKGVIALQLHAGPPMMISFKDIELKPLSAK